MELRESEIFNEYVKIAEKEGLVKESDYADVRIGTDTPSVIEALYGVRPNDEKKNQQYSQLLDQAHPETVVIAPAHDRLNGVLENLKQRQSIMMGIALKTPDGALIQRRYVKAHQDLLDSLVRVGFTLDSAKEIELMKVADNCADRLVKEAQLFTGIAIALAAVLGLTAAINHTDYSRQNVAQNARLVIEQVSDIKDSPLAPAIIADMNQLIKMAGDIQPIEANLGSLQGVADASHVHANDLRQMQDYKKLLQEVDAKIPTWATELQQTAEGGESSADWWEKLKDIAHFFVASDTTDVVHALGGLDKSIKFALNEMEMYLRKSSSLSPQIAQYLQQNPEMVAQVAPPTVSKPAPSGEGGGGIGEELSGLVSKLVG